MIFYFSNFLIVFFYKLNWREDEPWPRHVILCSSPMQWQNQVCNVTDISQIGQSTVKTYHECDLSGSEHTTWVRQAARVGPGLGFGPDLVSYAGFITARHPQFNSHLYFWFFPSQADPSNDPIILWLQVKQFRNIYPVLEPRPTFFEFGALAEINKVRKQQFWI